MSAAVPSREQVQQCRDRILRSRFFCNAQRSADVLTLIVDETLEGRALTGPVIGEKLKPKADPNTIAVQIGEIRKKLQEYYESPEGRRDPVNIDVPLRQCNAKFSFRTDPQVAENATSTSTLRTMWNAVLVWLPVPLAVVAVMAVFVFYFLSRPDSATVVSYDFEIDHQSCGRHGNGEMPVPGSNVKSTCGADPKPHSGRCSLEISLAEFGEPDIYVAVASQLEDASEMEGYVTVKPQANSCAARPPVCSTARLIVWDANDVSHEGDSVQLQPGLSWPPLKLSFMKSWPGPFKRVGIHFYRVTGFDGPVYIDDVRVLTRSQIFLRSAIVGAIVLVAGLIYFALRKRIKQS